MKIAFEFLDKEQKDEILPHLFRILAPNMNEIAPTGNCYDEDFRMWYEAVSPALAQERRQILLIWDGREIVGYFQYYVNETTFMMEEIQLKRDYQGRGIFEQLYSFLAEIVPAGTLYVEAYAHKRNRKSQGILTHLGLRVIGENQSGNSYHFRGEYRDLAERYGARGGG